MRVKDNVHLLNFWGFSMVVIICKMFRSLFYLLPLLFLYQVICANEGARWINADLAEISQVADTGDGYAQGFLALCHLHGDKGLNISFLEARFHAENSASRGHWLGNFVLGYLSRYKPLGPDPSLVAKYLLKSFRDPDGKLIKFASLGDPVALYVLAEIFISEEIQTILQPDMKMAADYYDISAQSGYAPATVQSALIKLHSLRDSLTDGASTQANGIALLQVGVDQKFPAAHHYLGRCFLEGMGIKEDKALALIHFQAAADRGYGAAQMMVADFYAYGLTGEPNEELAFKYVEQAVEMNHEGAAKKREEYKVLFGHKTEATDATPGIEQPEASLAETPNSDPSIPAAPIIDPPKAQPKSLRLPSAYAREEKAQVVTVNQDINNEDGKEPERMDRIAGSSINQIREKAKKIYWGQSTSNSMTEAFNFFEKCATLGDAESARYLGIMYLRGKGVSKNSDEAIKWFERAASQGDELAEKNLVSLRKIMKM